MVTESTLVYDAWTRELKIVYLAQIAEDTTKLVRVLQRVRVSVEDRTNGLRSRKRSFGFMPRVTIRRDYCTAAALARDDPEAHALASAFASVVARYYAQYGPSVYASHQEMTAYVAPEYVLEDGPFTSGVINRDNPLPYHFDTGNFQGVWSNMLGFKRGVLGGHLVVPQYDFAFEIADKSLLMFDGQGLLHGVTLFSVTPDGYRFTIVYYSAAGMWDCLPPGEELAHIQQLETQRAQQYLKQG